MHTQTTKTFQHVSDEKLATLSRSRWNWNRIRTIAFWTATFVVVFELTAGSMWSLLQIEWVRVQLSHLGYPDYFAYISGAWQVGGAAVIIAPRLPRLKEWAYAGAFFQWSGAVATHLLRGDYMPVNVWLTPLMFAMFAIASWALRPADRRLPNSGLPPESTSGQLSSAGLRAKSKGRGNERVRAAVICPPRLKRDGSPLGQNAAWNSPW